MKPGISVQMYTLRALLKEDFLGTFAKVAAIGYRGVELAGTGGLPAAELKQHLDALGLKVSGAHVGIGELEKNLSTVIEYYKAIGSPFVICPKWPPERCKTEADWAATGRSLGDMARNLNAAGLGFGYHNHDFEMAKYPGGAILDIMFAHAGLGLQCELDTFWVQYAGDDPVARIRRFASRLPLVHVKDMQAGSEKRFAPVGTGIMDWKAILPAAEQAGAQWFVVEQDNCYDTPPLDAIRTSFENLQRMGAV